MIWNELQKIKSFASSLESDVTTEDIEKKERELGVQIPTPLKEFYLTFHREDPIFSAPDNRIFSLHELAVYHSEGYTLVSFYSSSLGGREIYQLGFIPDLNTEATLTMRNIIFKRLAGVTAYALTLNIKSISHPACSFIWVKIYTDRSQTASLQIPSPSLRIKLREAKTRSRKTSS